MRTNTISFKTICFLSVITLLTSYACKEASTNETDTTIEERPIKTDNAIMAYDSILAKKYGADDYGMRSYVIAFLKRGPNREMDSAKAVELQMAHMKNIRKMAEEKKLILAGPFLDNGDLRGIYIFDVPTVEEAEALTNTDPAIQAGSLVMELKPWYGSAALMGVSDTHKTLQKSSITE